MKRALLLALTVATLGIITACNSPQAAAVSGLAVELASIERTGDGAATVTIRIINPNVVAYNVAKAEHRIHLNGRLLGTVKIDRPVGVPAQNSSAQQIGSIKLDAGATLPSGIAEYRMESELLLRLWGESTQDLELSSSGNVTVK